MKALVSDSLKLTKKIKFSTISLSCLGLEKPVVHPLGMEAEKRVIIRIYNYLGV